jgi:hypothetical protein
MHASLWRFRGDPDDLARRYDEMLASVPPEAMRLHVCLRAEDGIVLLDTCPDRAAFEHFATHTFPALRAQHGFPDPESVEDLPVHVAFVDGTTRS